MALQLQSEVVKGPSPVAFCSYCGWPPKGAWHEQEHRVCGRCKLGMVLLAPADAAPSHDDIFLIVDWRLMVQGISRQAEEVLAVDEPAAVDVPLRKLVVPSRGARRAADLDRAVTRATRGAPLPNAVDVQTVGPPRIRFR